MISIKKFDVNNLEQVNLKKFMNIYTFYEMTVKIIQKLYQEKYHH